MLQHHLSGFLIIKFKYMPAPKDPLKYKEWIEKVRKGAKIAMAKPEVKKKHKRNIRLAMARPDVKKKMRENQPNRSGKNHPKFINGKTIYHGYYYIWSETENMRIKQSRYIAEKCLDRKLVKGEEVHHINENKLDDSPKNLYVFATTSEHTRHHKMKNPPIISSNII